MATNHWVKDRVLSWLAKDLTIRAKELKKRLEEQYHLKLSYYVVWDGRNMAVEQLKGKWDDSFEHAFSFKAEVEKTNPGSLVDIEYARVGKKMRVCCPKSLCRWFSKWLQVFPWRRLYSFDWEMEGTTCICYFY